MRTALTNVNTVAFTPIPSASAITATAVNQRSFTSRRTAKRRSCSRAHVVSCRKGGRATSRRP